MAACGRSRVYLLSLLPRYLQAGKNRRALYQLLKYHPCLCHHRPLFLLDERQKEIQFKTRYTLTNAYPVNSFPSVRCPVCNPFHSPKKFHQWH